MRKFLVVVILLFKLICNIHAQTISGQISDRDYVDLQLPSGILWATHNIGANRSTDYGDYYAWGEILVKSDFNWSSYKWCNGSEDSLSKYCFQKNNGAVDSLEVLTIYDDAAVSEWGGGWRIPTREELDELIEGCTWEWINDYKGSGINGRMGTSKINNNTIFFPTAGYRDGDVCVEKGVNGYYWSSSVNLPYSMTAIDLVVSEPYFDCRNYERYYGLSIRAVLENNYYNTSIFSDQRKK